MLVLCMKILCSYLSIWWELILQGNFFCFVKKRCLLLLLINQKIYVFSLFCCHIYFLVVYILICTHCETFMFCFAAFTVGHNFNDQLLEPIFQLFYYPSKIFFFFLSRRSRSQRSFQNIKFFATLKCIVCKKFCWYITI